MFTSLLILSILGFVYLMYVLVKPEKFDLLVKTGAETPQKQENATL